MTVCDLITQLEQMPADALVATGQPGTDLVDLLRTDAGNKPIVIIRSVLSVHAGTWEDLERRAASGSV